MTNTQLDIAPGPDHRARSATIPELGIYLLPGDSAEAAPVCQHAAEADALGFGTLWISEKFNQKDASVLLGAVSQVATRSQLGSGVIHPHTRHPLVLAAFGSTMQVVSGGRFTLGVGRASPNTWRGTGLPWPTTAMLRDVADVLRRLWAGETVSYSGPAGNFPSLRIRHPYDGAPPLLAVAAVGPKTLAMAGAVYDTVILRPFLTARGLADSVAIVHQGARAAGRDPAGVRIVQPVVVGAGIDPEHDAAILGGRLVRYLHAPGGSAEQLPRINGWDASIVEAVRAHPVIVDALAAGRRDFTLPELAGIADEVIPDEWLAESAAVGTPDVCARRIGEYVDAGANEVILHGNVPADLAEVVAAFRRDRAT